MGRRPPSTRWIYVEAHLKFKSYANSPAPIFNVLRPDNSSGGHSSVQSVVPPFKFATPLSRIRRRAGFTSIHFRLQCLLTREGVGPAVSYWVSEWVWVEHLLLRTKKITKAEKNLANFRSEKYKTQVLSEKRRAQDPDYLSWIWAGHVAITYR